MLEVVRQPHGRHAAAPELTLDVVSAGKGDLEVLLYLRHAAGG
jgi:hypothetical protein